MGLLELFQKAKPAERAAVARELVDVGALTARIREDLARPDPALGRVVMDPAERKALAEEDLLDREATIDGPASLAAQIAALEREREALNAKLERLYGDAFAGGDGGYSARRNERWRRLWAGREPLVEELIARCLDEVAKLWPPSALKLPGERRSIAALSPSYAGGRGVMLTEAMSADRLRREAGVVVTTAPFVTARQAGLRELAETVRKWGERGGHTDAPDLQAKFDRAYAALPKVPALDDLVRRARGGAPLLGGTADVPGPEAA